jgi:hypothetical protein
MNQLLKTIAIFSISLGTAQAQVYSNKLPGEEFERRQRHCQTFTLKDFTQDFIFELSNRLQVDPASIRLHSARFEPSIALFGGNGDNGVWLINGVCEIFLAHPKGVHKEDRPLPRNLWYGIRIEQKEAPVVRETEDYRDQCKGKYTPQGWRRNKWCELVY